MTINYELTTNYQGLIIKSIINDSINYFIILYHILCLVSNYEFEFIILLNLFNF
jgi:hypothetical protein